MFVNCTSAFSEPVGVGGGGAEKNRIASTAVFFPHENPVNSRKASFEYLYEHAA